MIPLSMRVLLPADARYAGLTPAELAAAFLLVADPVDWRRPVAGWVPHERLLAVLAAVPLYTDTPAWVERTRERADGRVEHYVIANGRFAGPTERPRRGPRQYPPPYTSRHPSPRAVEEDYDGFQQVHQYRTWPLARPPKGGTA
jgi:hypothetical protein